MDQLTIAYVSSIVVASLIYIIYVAKNSSPSSFFTKRTFAYILLATLLGAFAIRETKLLGDSIPWLLQLDKTILFFSDNQGPIYSTINYAVILACLFGIGLLRTFQASTLPKKPKNIKVLRINKQGKLIDNPFLLVFSKLKLKKEKK